MYSMRINETKHLSFEKNNNLWWIESIGRFIYCWQLSFWIWSKVNFNKNWRELFHFVWLTFDDSYSFFYRNFDFLSECHLYCCRKSVDYNNNYTVHCRLTHVNCNKLMTDYTNMNNNMANNIDLLMDKWPRIVRMDDNMECSMRDLYEMNNGKSNYVWFCFSLRSQEFR